MTLRRARQAAFEGFLGELDEPGSAGPRHYLSQEELTRRFGPTLGSYREVKAWLRSSGFTIVSGSRDRLTITVKATVGEAERAFAVRVDRFTVNGHSVYGPDADPAVPSVLADRIQSISGLSDLARPEAPGEGDGRAPAAGRRGEAEKASAALLGAPLARTPSRGSGPLNSLTRRVTRALLFANPFPAGPSGAAAGRGPLTVEVFEKLCIGGFVSAVTFTTSGWLKVLLAIITKGFASLLESPGFVFGTFFCASLGGVIGAQYANCLFAAEAMGAEAWSNPECSQFKGAPNFGRNFGHPPRKKGKGGKGKGALRTAGRAVPLTGRAAAAGEAPLAESSGGAAKIGLVEFDTFNRSDVSDWLQATGSSASMNALSEVPVNGGVASPGSGEGEVLLDIDTVMYFDPLPGTRYVVYDAPPQTSFESLFNAMLGDGDTVISNSWSQCEDQTSEAEAQAIDSILAQAEASGVTVVNGSGDTGGTCLDGSGNTIGVPSDSPHAIAVGGTTLDEPKSETESMSYPGERWWNGTAETPQTGAGGFGVSRYFARPGYQEEVNEGTMRSVPDVVAPANPEDGVLICEADRDGCPGGERYGGTSFAAPFFAALASLGHGLTVSSLYTLAEAPGVFHDAESMGSDFEHVGLGSIDLSKLLKTAEEDEGSPVSAAHSLAAAAGTSQASAQATSVEAAESVPADGSSEGFVHVVLLDQKGFPVSGKTVTITPASGSHAVVRSEQAITDADGGASFTVTDTSVEEVAFTVEDVTDGITLTAQPLLRFVAPAATGAQLEAGPTKVPDEGAIPSRVSVYLQNGLGRPAAGKRVKLMQTGVATITPTGQGVEGETALTDAAGEAIFEVLGDTPETDVFTAEDVTDELPVPGSTQVTFYSGSVPACPNAAKVSAGYSLSSFAAPFTGDPYEQVLPGNFPISPCAGVDAPAFNSSGDAYVGNNFTGSINVLGPTGGVPSQSDELPEANYGREDITGMAFGPEGDLYASLSLPPPAGVNDNEDPEVVQLNPSTGAIQRVVATHAQGVPFCPDQPVFDPLSGDLFVSGGCTGYLYSGEIARIHNPSSANPTVTDYANTGGIENGVPYQMVFAPDGTMYAAVGGNELVRITATSSSEGEPHAVEKVLQYVAPGADFGVGLAITSTKNGDAATLLASGLGGNLYAIDLEGSPAAAEVAERGSEGGYFGYETVGPDGCVYIAAAIAIDRVGAGSGCGLPGNVSQSPSIALSSPGPSPAATGSSATYTAKLANFPSPAGTAVRFVVEGTNAQVGEVNANGQGEASFSYEGVHLGRDRLRAFAEGPQGMVESAPLEQRWSTGRDTSSLSLNMSQGGGPLGSTVTLRANLTDVSVEPVKAIAGEAVTLALAGQSCTAVTDASGSATCQVTLTGEMGLDAVSGSYGGSAAYTPAQSSNVFLAGPVGLAPQPEPPGPGAPGPGAPGPGPGPGGTGPAGTSPAGTGPGGGPSGPEASSSEHKVSGKPASLCGALHVDLLDVYVSHGRVRLLGYADPSLAGKKVKISSVWNRKLVAKAKIAASGYFAAAAKAPPARMRHSAKARYRARVGSFDSPALKLSRRLYVFAIARAGKGKVKITGRVVKPLAKPPAKITVTRRDSCQAAYKKVKAKVKLRPGSGRFTISTGAASKNAPGAVYRLRTEVRASRTGRRTFTTYSLPRTVGH